MWCSLKSLVGAIFEDSDYYKTKEIILPYLENKINLDKIEGILDYKRSYKKLTQLKFKTTLYIWNCFWKWTRS